jgi:branched-chain amino acid transport system permease protein
MTESRTATLFTDPPSVRPPSWLTPFRALWPMVLAVLIAGFAFFVLAPQINAYHQDLVSRCGIAIILAVSLTVVNGFTGQFSIGHSGFMSLGGYAAASLMFYGSYRWLGNTESHGGVLSGMPGHWFTRGDLLFLVSLSFGGIVAAIIGLVVGLPSLRLRGDYLAIVTLGFCEIVRVVIQSTPDQLGPKPSDPDDVDPAIQYMGTKPLVTELHHLGGALGFSGAPTYTTVFWVMFFVLLTLALTIRLKYSSYGRAMLSIREDDIAAQAVGVNITKLKVRAFVFSAFFAGVAGGLFALKDGTINAGELGFQRSFDFVIMVVLGGMGSISGAAIAAIVLTLLPECLRSLDSYRMVIFSLLLIVMMIVRPQGLFGIREIWDYLPVKWQWWNRPTREEEGM